MAGFTLYFKRRKVGEYAFNDGRIRIGRHPESEIFIPHQSISRLHATLEWKKDRWILENVGAQNGLFLNGTMIRVATRVNGGDRIEFGNYTLHVEGAEAEKSGGDLDDMLARLTGKAAGADGMSLNDPPPIAPKATGTEQHDMTFKLTPQQVVEQRKKSHKLLNVHLAWKTPQGEELVIPLGNTELTIGCATDADIQIDSGLMTGKVHARLIGSDGRHELRPEAWWTKVTLNGQKVKDSRLLKDGDTIVVGNTTLSYRSAVFEH